jgi:hypothetical protein
MSKTLNRDTLPGQGEFRQSSLERKYIREFLKAKGYTPQDLIRLPKEEASRLMRAACLYASLKLAEVESRAGFKYKIRRSD